MENIIFVLNMMESGRTSGIRQEMSRNGYSKSMDKAYCFHIPTLKKWAPLTTLPSTAQQEDV
ncbi:hypothetical protein JCM12296A_45300 [Desulfosarcina cetonica]